MALNLYGFENTVIPFPLMVRAHSREEAQLLFNAYIDLLNETSLTELQIIKEIPESTLRASDFNANGIINGGDPERLINPDAKNALYINNAENSYAITPNAPGNTPAGAFTFIFNAKSNDWTQTNQTFLSKFDEGVAPVEPAYLFEALQFLGDTLFFTRLTDDEGFVESASLTFNANPGQILWLRMTWNGSGRIDQYISTDSPAIPYDEVEWGDPTVTNLTPFTLQISTDNVTVGAQEFSGRASEDPFNGIIYRALLIDGTDATAAASMDMNPEDYGSGNSWVSNTGETWQLNGDAVIQPYE